ncbi:hypothetical protein AGABI1DRAFT_57760 [Agaricus bisporus var. burnettii JB137-S8]|uniref:Uncharacterized protein n=1 Tax=Agaricus bisporus var. burnettii (strain JB137-S8 / ATCC MYA-4627 / FGSC 10392) TaxID=597362 RepID=K5XAF0_AGABU|nr:uncharacterized protein AGABI1DRAFT_57760 [Agaricus bisporus var. burnettii JB137-S8]EKM80213.1 hypothetical protein AGABI1DRAFT_57760 [Agaricus bisporus var. burnettii JB137-S8]
MSIYRILRLTQRRAFVSSLFGLTFVAAVVTVSASSILPCPARPNKDRYLDSNGDRSLVSEGPVNVAKRPRRWIEEKGPC